ncbi:MAG: hypothetical protein SFU56_14465 [Capsulimonadales bacterium]|nr:hypothetical protein [Capsulimonadales bacterium]
MRNRIIPFVLCGISVGLLTGCGSKSGALQPVQTSITRADAGNYSTDARILASRESTDGWISAAIARQADTDLSRIRALTDVPDDIHARPQDDPDSVLVDVAPTAPWKSNWVNGQTTSGVDAIDRIGETYRLTGVTHVGAFSTADVFKLTFADPLATRIVAERYAAAGNGITAATGNPLIGDGDNITRQVSGDTRVYVFSRGWGDCPAGCTRRHFWTVTLTQDGGTRVEESGTPLP